MMPETGLSNRQLCYVFAVSFLFFSLWRWDITDWLEPRLHDALVKYHVPLEYQQIDVGMLGISLSQVSVQHAALAKPLLLDSVNVSLSWPALWHGDIALDVQAENAFLQAESLLLWQDDQLVLKQVDAHMDVREAQKWAGMDALFQAAGELLLQGDIKLSATTGEPLSIHADITWEHAQVNMFNQTYVLGDYHLSVQDQAWHLQGGKQLQLAGDGTLAIGKGTMLQWPLQGSIQVKAEAGSAILAILPFQKATLHISGTLASPHWQIQKD